MNRANDSRWIRTLVLGMVSLTFGTIGSAVHADDAGAWFYNYRPYQRDSAAVMRVVEPLTRSISESVVQVLSDGRPVALGTVVSEDGYVLTKRSELTGDPLRVRLAGGDLLPARVAAVRRENDLALLHLRVDGPNGGARLRPVSFDESVPQVGGFMLSAGRSGRPIGLGVVGARLRPIAHAGRLGVVLDRAPQGAVGATVQGIWPGSGADRAGIELGDRIVAINGTQQSDRYTVIGTLHKMYPGEVVRLTIERQGSTLDLDAEVRDFAVIQESENDTKVNGPRSGRLSGFEQAIQHDTVLDPDECGGPVLDSQGRVVGINIARAGRIVSYALPSSVVMAEMVELLEEARATAE